MAESFEPFAKLPRRLRWAALVGLSLVFAGALELARLPAALLLGPMLAAILIEIGGGALRLPRPIHFSAQALIGCLIANAFAPGLLATFLRPWPLFICVVLAVIAASSLLGWTLGKLRIVPGSTAIWGLSPGAASTMMLLAGEHGADPRIVAFMQYVRVVCVASTASLVARLWAPVAASQPTEIIWFPSLHWSLAATLALAAISGFLGLRSRMPGGVMLAPMAVLGVMHGAGLFDIQLPPWLLAASFACIGWSVGFGFTRKILVHALRVLPQTLIAIFTLIAFCGGLAFALVELLGVDPLTAYLATSPGGMDSVAIIAAASNVDLPFVMTLQTVRFTIVLLVGPYISRFVARKMGESTAPFVPELAADAAELALVEDDEPELD